MKPISTMIARRFIEVAADAYVRGEDYRQHRPAMKKVGLSGLGREPPEDYLDQLWGRCLTIVEAGTYRALIEQLVDALRTGDLPSHKPPLMVLNPAGAVNLESDYIYLHEFRTWSEKNRLNYPKNWHALVMAATEPRGEPVRIEGTERPVQLRTPRGPVPDAKKNAAYLEGSESLIGVAQELVDGGQKLTAKTLGKALEAKYRNTKASVWKRDYIAAATMASIKSQINHD
jgi:hypothetical protein